MQRTKIKAAFLLLVFSINTIVSFACSAGISLSRNEAHQEHLSDHPHGQAAGHVHTGSHTQAHPEKLPHAHDRQPSGTRTHEEANEGDDCCSDDTVKLMLLDKLVTSTHQKPAPLPVAALAAVYDFLLTRYDQDGVLNKPKPFMRSWAPATHTDIRTVIQSFQI